MTVTSNTEIQFKVSLSGGHQTTPELEFFATDAAVALLETASLEAHIHARPAALVALAWQMRQKDTRRALALADEAQACMATTVLENGEHKRLEARLMLIRGEAKYLFDELDAAQTLVDSAMLAFVDLADAIGLADSHYLQSYIAIGRGNAERRHAELLAMIAVVEAVEPVRAVLAKATLARSEAFGDSGTARDRWEGQLLTESIGHSAGNCHIEFFLGILAYFESDFVRSIRHFDLSYSLALETGQIARAISAASNIGTVFDSLNDHSVALEWRQRELDLARSADWPSSHANALVMTADTLRNMKRFDAAHDMLRESMARLAAMAYSRSYAIALEVLGKLEFDRQHFDIALETFQLLEQRAIALCAADLLFIATCGQGEALLHLDHPQLALEKAQAALDTAKSNAASQIRALRVLAEIHARHPLLPTAYTTAANPSLHYSQMALDLAATIENFTIPGELLDTVAREYARMGDYQKAYEFGLQATAARVKIQSVEANNRAVATQIRHETESAHANSERNRLLAAAHAERADALEKANGTLEQLGSVGREITSNLEASAIFAALDRHVHALLDATTFWIYRIEPDGKTLRMVFGVEGGQTVATHVTRMDDPLRQVARCARERKEFVQHVPPGTIVPIDGTLETLSLMFAPLTVGDRLLGVMTIQSITANAYSDREVAIFRTLCAYGAIALTNDERTRELLDTNKELARLSITDRLTGLFNRLRLDQVLEDRVLHSRRYSSCFSIVLLDIDHFKSVNDKYGHPVGDQVLVDVARLLAEGTREVDVVGRWGGEEFLIICPDTAFDGAMAAAEKLRGLIASHSFDIVGYKSASFGVTTVRPNDTIPTMMARADEALYRCKANGRNCVEGSIS